ncbi:MAG: hypothetical protein AAGA15_00080 [Pseudomonadota bacterium]
MTSHTGLALLAGLALGATVLAFRLGWQEYWWDEHVTLMFTRVDWSNLMIDYWDLDTHRPVYYGLQKVWNGFFGESIAATRALPGALMLGAAVAIYFAARAITPGSYALTTLLIFVTSPMFVYQGREIRGYGLMNLGLTLALVCLVLVFQRVERRPSPDRAEILLWVGFAASMALAFYANSAAIFVAATLGLWILAMTFIGGVARRFLWGGLAAGGLFTLLIMPALIPFFSHLTGTLGDTFWVPQTSFGWIYGQTLRVYSYPQWIKLPMALLMLWGAWSLRRRPRELSLILAVVVGFPTLVLVLSFLKPLFIARVIAWSGLGASLLVAAGLLALRGRGLRAAGIALISAAHIGALANFYPERRETPPYLAFAPILDGFNPTSDRLILGARIMEPALRWYYPDLMGGEVLAFNYSDSQQNVIDDAFVSRFVPRAAARRLAIEHRGERLFVLREREPRFRVAPGGGTDAALTRLTKGRPHLLREDAGHLRLDIYGPAASRSE